MGKAIHVSGEYESTAGCPDPFSRSGVASRSWTFLPEAARRTSVDGRTRRGPGCFGSSRKKEAALNLAGAIAYWVFNRNRDTSRGKVATGRVATQLFVDRMAVALPNIIPREASAVCGLVLTACPLFEAFSSTVGACERLRNMFHLARVDDILVMYHTVEEA